jgi:predicted enzyme related to lactoylglutathione lyase
MKLAASLRAGLIALATGLALVGGATAAASAQTVHVRSVRVPAADPIALSEFYKRAFHLSEVRRITFPTLTEIILNAGATQAEASASPFTPIVLMTRPAGMTLSPMAYLIMEVPDMDKALADVTAAGGTIFRPVARLADGTTYAFIKDPDGNQVELLLKR